MRVRVWVRASVVCYLCLTLTLTLTLTLIRGYHSVVCYLCLTLTLTLTLTRGCHSVVCYSDVYFVTKATYASCPNFDLGQG